MIDFIKDLQVYQILISILSVLMLAQGFGQYIKRKNHATTIKFLTRIFVWGGIGFVIIFPDFTMNRLSSVLGIKENFNALIFVGFLVVFIMIFKLLSIIENLEATITKIIRKEALREIEKK